MCYMFTKTSRLTFFILKQPNRLLSTVIPVAKRYANHQIFIGRVITVTLTFVRKFFYKLKENVDLIKIQYVHLNIHCNSYRNMLGQQFPVIFA